MDCMVLIIDMSAIYEDCACAFSEPSLLFSPFPRISCFSIFFRALSPKKHKIDDVAGSPAPSFLSRGDKKNES